MKKSLDNYNMIVQQHSNHKIGAGLTYTESKQHVLDQDGDSSIMQESSIAGSQVAVSQN